jgi:hypothetical protein
MGIDKRIKNDYLFSYGDLSRMFSYNNETGIIINKENGKPVGTKLKHSASIHLTIWVKGRMLYAHRIAWLLHNHSWPEGFIDHIDGDGTNNKINNLRVVSIRGNGQNRKSHRAGGLPGATFKKAIGLWVSQVQWQGRKYVLGKYKSESEASRVYLEVCEALDKNDTSILRFYYYDKKNQVN